MRSDHVVAIGCRIGRVCAPTPDGAPVRCDAYKQRAAVVRPCKICIDGFQQSAGDPPVWVSLASEQRSDPWGDRRSLRRDTRDSTHPIPIRHRASTCASCLRAPTRLSAPRPRPRISIWECVCAAAFWAACHSTKGLHIHASRLAWQHHDRQHDTRPTDATSDERKSRDPHHAPLVSIYVTSHHRQN